MYWFLVLEFITCIFRIEALRFKSSIEPTLGITAESTGQPSFSLSALGLSYACVKPTLPCRSWSSDTGVVLCLYYSPYCACIGQPAVGCHYRRSTAPVVYTGVSTKFPIGKRGKMNIQDEYLDIQLCDKHFIYSVVISKYSAVISKIFILTYFNILDRKAKFSDIAVQYLDITIETDTFVKTLFSDSGGLKT